jgi:hypothetical protein
LQPQHLIIEIGVYVHLSHALEAIFKVLLERTSRQRILLPKAHVNVLHGLGTRLDLVYIDKDAARFECRCRLGENLALVLVGEVMDDERRHHPVPPGAEVTRYNVELFEGKPLIRAKLGSRLLQHVWRHINQVHMRAGVRIHHLDGEPAGPGPQVKHPCRFARL